MEPEAAASETGAADPFAVPREVEDVADCDFYHVIDLPGFGRVGGSWDLRGNVERYLSDTDYRGRRVLEIGTADGYLATELEKRGAEVVAFDLGETAEYDCVPVERADVAAARARMRVLQRRRVNAFWLVRRQLRSRVRMAHGHAGALPAGLGRFDYCFLGNLLQHLENPLRALAGAAALAREGVIVTEANWRPELDQEAPLMSLLTPLKLRQAVPGWCFHWWQVTPGLLSQWLEILGFETIQRDEHDQLFAETGLRIPHFTVVARRRERG